MSDTRLLTDFAARIEDPDPVVTIDGGDYRIRPGLTARQWLPAILSDDPLAVLTLLDPDDEDDLLDALDDPDDPVDHRLLRRVCRELQAEASGWRWWEAQRLIVEAVHVWRRLDGRTAGRGVDPLDLRLDRFCDLVYDFVCGLFSEQKKLDAWLRELRTPPPSAADDVDDDVAGGEWDDEGSGWLAAAGAVSGGRA